MTPGLAAITSDENCQGDLFDIILDRLLPARAAVKGDAFFISGGAAGAVAPAMRCLSHKAQKMRRRFQRRLRSTRRTGIGQSRLRPPPKISMKAKRAVGRLSRIGMGSSSFALKTEGVPFLDGAMAHGAWPASLWRGAGMTIGRTDHAECQSRPRALIRGGVVWKRGSSLSSLRR